MKPTMIRHEIHISGAEKQMLEQLSVQGIGFPSSLERAVPKRKLEFLAGRFCAEQALKKAGYQGAVSVGMAQDRSPVWPEGYVGSITHTDGYACAVVAPKSELLGIGVDAEPIVDGEALKDICNFALLDVELALYEQNFRRAMTLTEFGTLVFSAKESVFKCLYPLVNQYFDFKDAQIVEIDSFRQTFRARLLRDLTNCFYSGFELTGSYQISDLICTFASIN